MWYNVNNASPPKAVGQPVRRNDMDKTKDNGTITLPGGIKTTLEEGLDDLRYTRDFDRYLDVLCALKDRYLIILCIRNTTGQEIPEATLKKICSLGFSKYAAEPDMKYAGISYNGRIVYDEASKADSLPAVVDVNAAERNFCVSFEGKEAGIKIDGVDQSLNDKGINILVYDCKKSAITDVSGYDASEPEPGFYRRRKNPEFYHRNMSYDKEYIDSHIFVPEKYKSATALPMRRSYFSNRRLNVSEVERGIFLPSKHIYGDVYGGVCDENFNFVSGHRLLNARVSHNGNDGRHIVSSYEVPREDITCIDETVLYGGTLLEHPGHLIVECFADRLWWLAQNAGSDIKIAVELSWEATSLALKYGSFVDEFLYAFGISRDRVIFIEKPTQFKKIIVPDQASVPTYYCYPYEFTSEYITPFRYIRDQLTPGKYKKIYLTKSNNHQKNTVGEEYFINFFEKKGFEIVSPEDHNIKEKAELMYGAEEIVTLDGTNSLFSVFCKPSVKLTVLTRRQEFWDTPQQMITEALGIKDFYLVNTSGSFLNNSSSDDPLANYANGMTFMYVTEDFKRYVKHVYNEELDVDPIESFKNGLFEYLSSFAAYSADSVKFLAVKNIKMSDILQSLGEIIMGENFAPDKEYSPTGDEMRIRKLKRLRQEENEINASKIRLLTDKAKEYIEENTALKQSLTQLEAENAQLREKNSELSSYMAEITRLLDTLESQGDPPSEQ